jgi:spindle assembly abnormal protein 6
MEDISMNKLNKIESIIANMKIEIIKNKNLHKLIKTKKEEINLNKYNISELSIFLKKQKNKINKSIIKEELKQNNINILKKNELIKKEIETFKNKYNEISNLLQENMEQLKYIKTTAEEQNFILENKIKEKVNLIKVIKGILCQLSLGIFRQFEYIQEIDNDYYKKEGGFEKETEKIMDEDVEIWNQCFIVNLMKQNKIINENKKLEKEKNILSEFITKIKNKRNDNKNNNIYENNEMVIQTNISTDDSISTDSLILDTEEQMDIEFTSKDYSSHKDIDINHNKENKEKNIIIPPLDLRLINFNMKNDFSYKEKSLSRKIFKLSDDKIQNERTVEENIDKLKEMIKYLKKKNKIMENKCRQYEDKISKIALSLYSK